MLVAGVLLAVLGIAASGRGSARTTYRPDPWRGAEWLVAGAGLATGLLLTGAAWVGVTGLIAPVSPPGWPTLPWVGVAAALLAMSPAVTAPRLPAAVATRQAVAA
jgi:energy-coupling factor transport system permease protein